MSRFSIGCGCFDTTMATQSDVRRIALSLPGAEPVPGRFAFGVQRKGKIEAFVWVPRR